MSLGLRHAALPVTDLQRSLKFYCDVLGFSPYHVSDADWVMVSQSGTTLSLIRVANLPPQNDTGGTHPGHLGVVVETPKEVDQAHSRLSQSGLSVGKPKLHRDGSYGFYFRDPDQNALELIFIPAHAHLQTNPSGAPTQGALLLGHGSRDPRWGEPFQALLESCRRHASESVWELAWMEFANPTLLEAAEALLKNHPSLTSIEVIPVFLSSGGHVAHDLPQLLDEVRKQHPQVTFRMGQALAESALVRETLAQAAVARLR
jgi:sirohydrochlorin cobaltochelatase